MGLFAGGGKNLLLRSPLFWSW